MSAALKQSILFEDDKAPYQSHSETSREAAEAIEPDTGTLRGKCLHHFRICGSDGATDEEQQSYLQMNPSTQRPRRIELVNGGWLKDSGKTRLTRSGRHAVVWIAL